MKAIYLFIYIVVICHVTGANAGGSLSNQILPVSILTLTNGQQVTANVAPGAIKLFKIWIPANAAHLRISYISQTPNMFIWSNFGSPPVLQTGVPRPNCEFPAITDELLGIPFTWHRCIFERPESGAYHYIRLINEGISTPSGINKLTVSYVPNGLSSVADVFLKADYIDQSSGNPDSLISFGVSGDIDEFVERHFTFRYDESLGRFEERNGGLCDSGLPDNPTYLKLELNSSQPIAACSFRSSWGSSLQWIQCSQGLVDFINAHNSAIINTDEFNNVNGQCLPDFSSVLMRGGFSYFHWFEIRPVINGQIYYKKVEMSKINQAF